MNLIDFLAAGGGRINGGGDFGWNCYPNAAIVDVLNADGEECGSCVYSRLTFFVYEAQAHDYESNKAFRWIDPAWLLAYESEACCRNVPADEAYDDVSFAPVSSESILRIIEKIANKTFTSRSDAPLEDPFVRSVDAQVEVDYSLKDRDFGPPPSTDHFDVSIFVEHIFEVDASSLEDALAKSKEFVCQLVPPAQWPEDLSWVSSRVTREQVARKFN